MREGKYIFTSESVTEGHPDKVSDGISDAILDALLAQDPKSRVACETMVSTGMVVISGEITTNAHVDYADIAREKIRKIGYDQAHEGFAYDTCAVLVSLDRQSPDIAQGVTAGDGLFKEQGAGDQGMMFGYASNETEELMPMPIMLAHRLTEALSNKRREGGKYDFIRPDGKSQVSVVYQDGKAVAVDTVVISTQHKDSIEHDELEKKYTRLQENYNNVNTQYKSLLDKNQELLSGSKAEAEKILRKLNEAQTALMAREDSLDVLEKEYTKRKQMLDELSNELNQARLDIQEKEKAYNDLQNELARKDSIMTSLRNSVAEALVGFENQGINIRKENGRVYVSMDEKLLFASGSFNINQQGKEIIKKLSVALQDKHDISILVEGHTDSIPYGGKGQLVDNWDLSVKRSTTIVREMVNNSNINPKNITAAGRSKYLPIETNQTKEGRSANRRTEIILMPNLSKLESIIND